MDRAELEAVCLGLQIIVQLLGPKLVGRTKYTVTWFCDRENLVRSAIWKNGKTVYKRSSNEDLWARFGYYERLFKITAIHVERNSLPWMAFCDHIAGHMRASQKAYYADEKNFFIDEHRANPKDIKDANNKADSYC